jgi:glutamate carboxypeptidase
MTSRLHSTVSINPLQLRKDLQKQLPEMLATLRKFVLAESPSLEKAPCDRCAHFVASEFRRLGTKVELFSQKERGAHIRASCIPAKRSAGQLLVLGHYDTVYAVGTLEKMPFRVTRGKIYGPGVFDMKAGIVQALFAMQALQRLKVPFTKKIVFFWTSDEEIGSDTSRRLIETEARRSDAVFVLEPGLGTKGLLKTARKGVGEAELIVHGRASHAGLAPEEGVNAIHELARLIGAIEKWNDAKAGVTINADLLEGGTRVNVIAENARATLDLRALTLADMRRVEKRLHSLRPAHRDAKLEIHGGFNRPPMERRLGTELFQRAKSLAGKMNLEIGECTAGGGSDGNLTAALGTPTLDGLGAVGDGAHSAHEHIIANAMPARSALLAALLASS